MADIKQIKSGNTAYNLRDSRLDADEETSDIYFDNGTALGDHSYLGDGVKIHIDKPTDANEAFVLSENADEATSRIGKNSQLGYGSEIGEEVKIGDEVKIEDSHIFLPSGASIEFNNGKVVFTDADGNTAEVALN